MKLANLPLFLTIGLFLSLSTNCVCAQSSTTADPGFNFNHYVKPLLTSRCFVCHGPDESSRESGLRLDTFDGATEDLGGYAAVTPGNLEESELVRRIFSEDESEVMPPSDHGDPLTDAQKLALKLWIKSGAKYESHWSYVSPMKPTAPDVSTTDHANWPNNDIDRHVLKQMLARKLTPEKRADRLPLARRVSLDLTGLPPTVAEADAFANDTDPRAYEKLVDKLLASDAYGEHWAAMWLDLARYADSAGYAEDKTRTIWAYRDYVIRSFQRNQPFDEFTIEQIAGDLLPEPSRDALIATAFHRNTLTNSEGGTDDEEFRSAAIVDRTNTTMAVWMGTTMACAQCHTHKYDPITQEEFFQVYAILNNTADNDQPSEKPVLELYDEQQIAQRKPILKTIASLERQLAEFRAASADSILARHAAEQVEWEKVALDDQDESVGGRFVRIEVPGKNRFIQLAEVQVFSGDTNFAIQGTASQSSTYPGGDAKLAVDGNTDGAFENMSVSHTQPQESPWWQLDLGAEQSINKIVIWNRTDADLFKRLDGFEVKILTADKQDAWSRKFAKASKNEQAIECTGLPSRIRALLKIPVEERKPAQAKTLTKYFVANSSSETILNDQLQALNSELDAIKPTSSVPVLEELAKPRTTNIQIRGSHANLGDVVQPGTPAAFHAIRGESNDRLALARWLVDRHNPLTARVTVNRYWQRLFGTGLVRTSEDFGAQGDLPSHPQLLDHLAATYMHLGWDNRAILKLMVMSATYQQDSRVSKEKRSLDPANRWLSRGPRFRVTAETVRDQALFSAGLLSKKMYGPPVQPPAPELGLKAAFSGQILWKPSTGEDRYRRAIYTQWRRSSPYPSLETFDVSNREVCDLRRISTNTPLQALVTLNDEVYIEAAQALARRITKKETDLRKIATAGFRHVLIREPTSLEVDELVRLFEESKTHFEGLPEQAKQLADDPLRPAVEGTNFATLAAWTTVANVLLNLDEVFLKR